MGPRYPDARDASYPDGSAGQVGLVVNRLMSPTSGGGDSEATQSTFGQQNLDYSPRPIWGMITGVVPNEYGATTYAPRYKFKEVNPNVSTTHSEATEQTQAYGGTVSSITGSTYGSVGSETDYSCYAMDIAGNYSFGAAQVGEIYRMYPNPAGTGFTFKSGEIYHGHTQWPGTTGVGPTTLATYVNNDFYDANALWLPSERSDIFTSSYTSDGSTWVLVATGFIQLLMPEQSANVNYYGTLSIEQLISGTWTKIIAANIAFGREDRVTITIAGNSTTQSFYSGSPGYSGTGTVLSGSGAVGTSIAATGPYARPSAYPTGLATTPYASGNWVRPVLSVRQDSGGSITGGTVGDPGQAFASLSAWRAHRLAGVVATPPVA